MSVTYTMLAFLAFVFLTVGTAVFVAAEFSLTALERSTVDANARTGGRRDKLVQRAHRTLSFQLSGAQVGISLTTLITGYLAEPLIARLLQPVFTALSLTKNLADGLALALALLIATSVSMVFGELVAQYLAVAKPLQTARLVAGPQVLFSMLFTPVIKLTNGTANWILRRLGIEPAEELRSARSPQELGSLVRNSARRGALDPITAALVDRSLQFGSRTAEELMTSPAKVIWETATVAAAAVMMHQEGVKRLPVVDGEGGLVGIVSRGDVLRGYLRREAAHQVLLVWLLASRWCPRRSTVMTSWPRSGRVLCRRFWWLTSTAAPRAWSPWRT
jgi:CBS domain containing-hemolysin-like protein